MEMLSEVKRILKEHFGNTSWTQKVAVEELAKRDML